MHNPDCVTCARPVDNPAAFSCKACAELGRQQLHDIADAAPAARDVVNGQSRRGPAMSGGGGGRIPVNLGAAARLDAVQNELTTWARIVRASCGGAFGHGHPLEAAARYLAGHMDWLRHERTAGDALRDIAACERITMGIVDPRADRRYLGPCRTDGCEADIYARVGLSYATCRTCDALHAVAERRAWLDGEVRRHSYTAAEIAEAYGIRAGTIRVWAHRGRVVADGEVDDRPTYPLGEVLDLAALEAARRATLQATRARQAEQEEHGEVDAA